MRVFACPRAGAGWLGTLGGSASGGRELRMWDPRNLGAGPLSSDNLGGGANTIFPAYEAASGLLALAGRGENRVRVFDVASGAAVAGADNVLLPGSPLCAIAAVPLTPAEAATCGVARLLRMTADHAIEPFALTLPRSDALKEFWQDDVCVALLLLVLLLPQPAALSTHPLSPTPRFAPVPSPAGRAAAAPGAALVSLRPPAMPLLSERPAPERKVTHSQKTKARAEADAAERAKEDSEFDRLAQLAIQRSHYHPNASMGRLGVDQPLAAGEDAVSDSEWDD